MTLLKELENMGVQLAHVSKQVHNYQHWPDNLICWKRFEQTRETNPELQRIKQNLDKGKSPGLLIHEDGSLRFQNCLCVPKKVEIRK